MLVINNSTGEKEDRNNLYKAPNNKYYSSKEDYEARIAVEEQRQLCIQKMYELLSYEPYMKIPTNFYKKLSEWKPYGFDKVLWVMNKEANSILWGINNKEFQSEIQKIHYICYIIENHLNDKRPIVKSTINNIEPIETDMIVHKQKTTDISSWIED